ncbi:MAG TPA: trypsin-like peptidase domain-containing protein [Bryobacteraceae bacterium]|nr:trypsin-like peptidase domain-containing protein [Bryobacteraceae bacterium]
MKTVASFILSLCLLAGTLAADDGQMSPQEKRVLEMTPGVVLVVVTYKVQLAIPRQNAEPLVSEYSLSLMGSGFLYRPDGYLITNAHVVADANVKDAQAQQARAERIIEYVMGALEHKIGRKLTEQEVRFVAGHISTSTPQIRVLLDNKASYNGEIKAYSDPTGVGNGKDVAILKIDGNNLPTVKLGNSDNVHIEEPITVVGYPGVASPLNFDWIGMESVTVPSVTNGHISAKKVDYKGTPVLQSDAAITHGNSGGAAFDEQGEVIGIPTYGSNEAAGFNFLVPINTAMEFVRQAGAAPQSGAFDKAWADALDAYSGGKWQSARAQLTDVLSLMPNEPDALRLETIAAQRARDENIFSRMSENALLLPVLGVLIAIAAGVAIWLAFSLRKHAPAAAVAGAPGFSAMPIAGIAIPPVLPAAAQPAPKPVAESFGSMHVTAGSLNGNRFPVPKAGLLIGRDAIKCNIVIADETVSKEHAWIVPLENEVVLIDRGSSNGTYVNSTDTPRVNKVALHSGDRVFIGKKGAAVLTYFR